MSTTHDPKAKQLAVTPMQKVRELLTRQHDQISKALPKFLTPDRFIRVALTTLNKNPKLLECTETSLMACLMDCAQLGLEPDNVMGRAYLIPFNDKRNDRMVCTLIIGYKGLCDLAYRSGKVKSLMAQIVCEKDKFDFRFGLEHRLDHVPAFNEEDRGKVIAVYAYAIMDNGVTAFDVMGVDDVERIKARSKSSDNGPWITDWDEMARKTVLKRLSKYLPLSVEFMDAVARDNETESEEERLKAAKIVIPKSETTTAPAALPPPEEKIPMPTRTEEREKVPVTPSHHEETDHRIEEMGERSGDIVDPEVQLTDLMSTDRVTPEELARVLKTAGQPVPRSFKGPGDLRDDVLSYCLKEWGTLLAAINSDREGAGNP